MTLSELVAAAYLKATGKRSQLTSTDDKYLKIRDIANGLIQSWESEYGIDWFSLYEKNHSIGTVSATDTFDLDDEIRKLSDAPGDFVQIVGTDGRTTNYSIVPANTLKRYESEVVCAQIGATLVFSKAFEATDAQFGGTINVPCYLYAEEMINSTDDVPVDIPRWLVVMTAAEYVRNDITKQNQYPNLVAEANPLMQRMIDDNEAQVSQVYAPWAPLGETW